MSPRHGTSRAVLIVLLSILFFGLGEQLWSLFLPAYLDAKASSGGVRNLFEAACYVGGGELTARLGDRGSLILFGVLTVGAATTRSQGNGPWRRSAVVGLRPLIGLSFIFFALFPLSLALAPGGYGLIAAFFVWGLREIGEPARKALIVSLLPPPIRARCRDLLGFSAVFYLTGSGES